MGRIKTLTPRVQALKPGKVQSLTVEAVARPKTAAWDKARERALVRDGGLCQACKAAGRVSLARHVDHRVPLWQGGDPLDASNLQSLCIPCHAEKTALEARQRAAGGIGEG